MSTQLFTAQSPSALTRLEAFSDGVFAIAITLLAMDLKVPLNLTSSLLNEHASLNWMLLERLAFQWPAFLAFAGSFFSILVMWGHHHAIFKMLIQIDRRVMFANGALLLLISAVPFSTGLLANYLQTPAIHVACAVYTGLFVLINGAFMLLFESTARQGCGLLKKSICEDRKAHTRKTMRTGAMGYWLAFLL
jgi:uncharacterized membrane protein